MNIERYIAIGDVHGCHEELETLLQKIQPGSRDQVVMLGDLVNHGPDSRGVLALARSVDAISLLGNHERRLLRHHLFGDQRGLKAVDRRTMAQLGPRDWDYLRRMRLFHHLPHLRTVFVHGGFLPGQDWRTQDASIVTRIQVVDDLGRPRKRSQSPGSPHWSELWRGPPFVVYGHTPRQQYERLDWSIGIDTACVQGGKLTALIIPTGEIIQVPALHRYIRK